jgi:hypothetical protein
LNRETIVSDEEDGENIDDNISNVQPSFIDCLAIIANKNYNLIDAYPNLYRVYMALQ